MSNSEIGALLLQLFALLATAQVLGHLFVRLRQPKVIGEILAGVLLGPSILGRLAPEASAAIFQVSSKAVGDTVLSFVYWLGLLLLMFASGAEIRGLFSRQDRRQITWLSTVGTLAPFLIALALSPLFPLDQVMGPAGNQVALLLVIGIAVAVTSIPVISRIFYDLKIMHTRFARLVLGVAVVEDIALWAVLAVATALAGAGALPTGTIVRHVGYTAVYFVVGLLIAPVLLKRLSAARWNVLAHTTPIGYVIAILFAYGAIAAALDVTLVFAAFLAGFAVTADRERFGDALDALHKFSFAVFIPIYFAVVGYKLDLSRSFSLTMLAVFLTLACVIKLASAGLGARLAGFRGLDIANLAVATNARGGPGIVLASVAFDAGIVNAPFYTTLVLVAVLTSQAAGAWLDYVLRRGWPLLSVDQRAPVAAPDAADEPGTIAA
jgi:Kef-type K+ transport system membrane component KefB